MGEEPEEERKRGAEEQASDDGEIKSGVFAAMNNVAGKFSETKGELVPKVKKGAKKDEESAEEEKRTAELTKRLHRGILPEAACKLFENALLLLYIYI